MSRETILNGLFSDYFVICKCTMPLLVILVPFNLLCSWYRAFEHYCISFLGDILLIATHASSFIIKVSKWIEETRLKYIYFSKMDFSLLFFWWFFFVRLWMFSYNPSQHILLSLIIYRVILSSFTDYEIGTFFGHLCLEPAP